MRRATDITPFGRRVKIRLLELGMDARQLAAAVGTSEVQISRIIHGKRPGYDQIPRIAEVLNIPLEEIEQAAGE